MSGKFRLFKLLPEKAGVWAAWCRTLAEKKEEVRETLEEENVDAELCAVFARDGQTFALFASVSAPETKPSTERELNIEHRAKIRECFVPAGEPAALAYGFTRR